MSLNRAFHLIAARIDSNSRLLEKPQLPGYGFRRQRHDGRQLQELRRRGGVVRHGRDDPELHDLSGCGGVGYGEINTRHSAAERLVGADVAEHVIAHRHVGEVHDHVGALGQTP